MSIATRNEGTFRATCDDTPTDYSCSLEMAFRQVERYPLAPLVDYVRRHRALSHLLRGGDPSSFDDQEALASVLPLFSRSRKRVMVEGKERG